MALRPREDPALQLLGRSRAERLLDSVYARQRQQLRKRRRQELLEERRRILLPEEREARRRLLEKLSRKQPDAPQPKQSSSDSAEAVASSATGVSGAASRAPKSVEAALGDLMQKHFSNRAKFARAVTLLRQLWEAYFKERVSRSQQRPFVAALLAAASTDLAHSDPAGREALRGFFETSVQPLLDARERHSAVFAQSLQRESDDRRLRTQAELQRRLTERVFSKAGKDDSRVAHLAAAAAGALQRAEEASSASPRAKEEEKEKGSSCKAEQDGQARLEEREAAAASPSTPVLREEFVALLRVLRIRCVTHARLETDDAFQFNGAMAELREVLQGLQQEALEGHEEETDSGDDAQEEEEEAEEGQGREGTEHDADGAGRQNAGVVEGGLGTDLGSSTPLRAALQVKTELDGFARVKTEQPSELPSNGRWPQAASAVPATPVKNNCPSEDERTPETLFTQGPTEDDAEMQDDELWPLPLR